MSTFSSPVWARRTWLTHQAFTLAAVVIRAPRTPYVRGYSGRGRPASPAGHPARAAVQAACIDPAFWQALAQQAVDAARTAGARYADVRLTRVVIHEYACNGRSGLGGFNDDDEYVGVGVRALVDGYWGFSASAVISSDEVVRLARDAVAQAQENAKGPPRVTELGMVPVTTGTWTTPLRIDPFIVTIEEKLDNICYWTQCFEQAGMDLVEGWLRFARQERVVATSDGALFTQTLHESGGLIRLGTPAINAKLHGIELAGAGWERFLDAKIPDQIPQIQDEIAQRTELAKTAKPSTVGRYTLVCDGATMAALVEQTLGVATQLDRALGDEANASGTSFLDDPLGMVGTFSVASPLVTLTANRSAPAELATVNWDDEGVVPEPFTLIKDGVLVDFQTTREQAAWLAPYYQRHNRPVYSHGCAAAEDAQKITMQHMPNLSLEPSTSHIQLDDLVADVPDGILVEGSQAMSDFQARTGLLGGNMREIKNGRVGRQLTGGVVLFNSKDLWENLIAIGGPSTQAVIGTTQYRGEGGFGLLEQDLLRQFDGKGQPPQITSRNVRAAAAMIPNQPIIDPSRKA